MSKIDAAIPNSSVIPVIESDIFSAAPDKNYALAMLAKGEQIVDNRESEYLGYLKLRASVYAYQTRMIDTSEVLADGTERDSDDARSVHWAVLERVPTAPELPDQSRLARVIASMRLITKDVVERPLPIETFFSDAFPEPLPDGAVEVSRYIARHEQKAVQDRLSDPLFIAAAGFIMSHELGPAYGVVEEKVERAIAKHGIPMRRIAEPRFVPEYAADNLGFVADVPEVARMWGMDDMATLSSMMDREEEVSYFDIILPKVERVPVTAA